MRIPSCGSKTLLLVCLFCVTLSVAWPQASTSVVRGAVYDQSQAAVPTAKVTLRSETTGTSQSTNSNVAGFYVFPGVLPGAYRLLAEAPGMQKYEATLTVQVQQAATVDVVLKVGDTATTVEVADATPLLIVDNPTLGHVLERQRIEQLPINGRHMENLLITVPGLEGQRAYGLRQGSHEFVVDGAVMTDRNYGGTQRRPPGLDTVEEFKVEVNNSSAKFTRPTTIIVSTKRGTNDLHGAVFETHRNNAIGKARARQDPGTKPPQLIRNEFGASAGGPVFIPKLYSGKNRTFWFAAYEGHRNIAPTTRTDRFPTEAMRNGDFSGLKDSTGRDIKIYDPWTTNPTTWSRQQFSYQGRLNVIDPARMSPLAKTLFDITPLPNIAGVNPLAQDNWIGSQPNTTRQWTVTTRFDHQFSDRDQVYGRYSQGDFYLFRPFEGTPMLNNVANTRQTQAPNKSLALSWVHSFSPTFFNEMLASAYREVWYQGTGESGRKYADELGLQNPFGASGWPGLYRAGRPYMGGYLFETENTQSTPFTYVVLDDNMTKVSGKHELQFGFHYRYDQLNVLPDQQQVQGNNNWDTLATSLYDPSTSRTSPGPLPQTQFNVANMYIGVMNYSNRLVRNYYYLRAREYSAYFQDNFRVTPRLTLNLGLRWEHWPFPGEKNNLMTSFDPGSKTVILGTSLDNMYKVGATVPALVNRLTSLGMKFTTFDKVGLSESMVDSTSRNFGPRLGFAYRMGDGARSLVLRGGYRMSYFTVPLRTFTGFLQFGAPMIGILQRSLTDASLSPDGIGNYGLRSVPTIIAGVNSRDAVTLDMLGSVTAGAGSTDVLYYDRKQPDSRVQDWNFTVEKEIMESTALRLSFIGNHGTGLEQFYRFNESTPEYIWYVTKGERLPTGPLSNVLRRPFDQQVYGNIRRYQKTGYSNYSGFQVEVERRYSKGYAYQFFYVTGNAINAGGRAGYNDPIQESNLYLPGALPTDMDERNRFLNYRRDIDIPKHRVRWNWIADLPFGKGKWLAGNAGGFLNGLIGGWQVAGIGFARSNYFTLPTNIYPTGNKIEIYGREYPIQDCRGGVCRQGYLYWNGYIPAHQINSVDATGKPNGVMGVPSNYKSAAEPINPWPANPNRSDPNYAYYGTNSVLVTLNDGSVRRTNYDIGLHPWRNQFLPAPWIWGLDASLFKSIPITERVVLRFNADFFNVLNRPGLPTGVGGDGINSTWTSGLSARELQLTLRLSW